MTLAEDLAALFRRYGITDHILEVGITTEAAVTIPVRDQDGEILTVATTGEPVRRTIWIPLDATPGNHVPSRITPDTDDNIITIDGAGKVQGHVLWIASCRHCDWEDLGHDVACITHLLEDHARKHPLGAEATR